MAEGEERDERRYPQNLQGILKFCVDNTKSEDATGESQFSEMTAEGGVEGDEEEDEDAVSLSDEMIVKDEIEPVIPFQMSKDADIQASNDAAVSNGPRLALKRCNAFEDLEGTRNKLDLIEEVTQSSGSSGDTADAPDQSGASDTASLAESLPDIEAARRNQDHALATLGLYRYKIPSDGNCMFRAVASQLNLDQEKYHSLLRQVSLKWMRQHMEELLGAGLLDTEDEIEEMVMEGSWPNQAALVALSNVLSTNIAIIQGGDKGSIDIQHITPITPPPEDDQSAGVKLAYLYNGHYDSVVNEPNLSNPTYTHWAAQAMKENVNLSRSMENLLDSSSEPYLPYAGYNSPWHRKDRVPEGDLRRSLSRTPDILDSDCSGMSDGEGNLCPIPAFEVDDVTIPDVCTFVCEMPAKSVEKLVHVNMIQTEKPRENCVEFTHVGNNVKEESPEDKGAKRRSAMFIMLGQSEDDMTCDEDDHCSSSLNKSRSLGDLTADPVLMAENVKEEITLPFPDAENSTEIFVASPPRTITSPPVLQPAVKAKIFPARRRNVVSATVNVNRPKSEHIHLEPNGSPSIVKQNEREQFHVFIPPPSVSNGSKTPSPTVRVLPLRLNKDPISTPQVLLSPIQASIKADGPVKITMDKEDFLRGVTDPSQIKVEKHAPPISHAPRVQQMNSVWVAPSPGEKFIRHSKVQERPADEHPVDHLWEKNMWTRSSPTGQSSHNEPIHVEIPINHSYSQNATQPPRPSVPPSASESYSVNLNSSGLGSLFPSHHLDFSRSTQTNLKLSSPAFPPQGFSSHSSDQFGGVFNLDKFLSPLRRDVDADYIESLLKQQWFR